MHLTKLKCAGVTGYIHPFPSREKKKKTGHEIKRGKDLKVGRETKRRRTSIVVRFRLNKAYVLRKSVGEGTRGETEGKTNFQLRH